MSKTPQEIRFGNALAAVEALMSEDARFLTLSNLPGDARFAILADSLASWAQKQDKRASLRLAELAAAAILKAAQGDRLRATSEEVCRAN